jgi:hypothetical protein
MIPRETPKLIRMPVMPSAGHTRERVWSLDSGRSQKRDTVMGSKAPTSQSVVMAAGTFENIDEKEVMTWDPTQPTSTARPYVFTTVERVMFIVLGGCVRSRVSRTLGRAQGEVSETIGCGVQPPIRDLPPEPKAPLQTKPPPVSCRWGLL